MKPIITKGTIGNTKRFQIIPRIFIFPIKNIMIGNIPILAQILGDI